jgi:hypothetical protein
MCLNAAQEAEVVFKVGGANIITSQIIRTEAVGKASVEISTNNGLSWQELLGKTSEGVTICPLLKEVNASYEVLVKVKLAAGATLKSLAVNTVTMINSKTQPKLNLGRNTIYVGAGEPTDSIVYWPDCSNDKGYKEFVSEEKNVACGFSNWAYYGALHPANNTEDAWVVFKMDAPGDITSVTMSGRFSNRYEKNHVDMLYSLDGGKTWTTLYSLTSIEKPYDTIAEEKSAVPQGRRSVLFKYFMTGGSSVHTVRMEADYKCADAAFRPVEVTFAWGERQKDRTLVRRSHTQLVAAVPFKYVINTAGADHPVMESLTVALAGVAQPPSAGAVSSTPAQAGAPVPHKKYGYSDGAENADATKYVHRAVSIGKNFAEGKKYTLSVPSGNAWGAGDPKGTKLTDGVVGADYCGGPAPSWGILWDKPQESLIDVDLGETRKCGAFRIHITSGWPWPEAVLKGDFTDKVELLTSLDGKEYTSRGEFVLNLWYKDIPINHMLPDCEQLTGCNFELIVPKPVDCRYVRYKVLPGHGMVITEVQALDFIRYEPFDIRIALPDEK